MWDIREPMHSIFLDRDIDSLCPGPHVFATAWTGFATVAAICSTPDGPSTSKPNADVSRNRFKRTPYQPSRESRWLSEAFRRRE